MRGRVGQPGHERQELGEATRPAICQDQRGSAAATGPFVHEMHPDTIDPGPEVTEPVQPAFLRAPVEAVRPVRQQVPQVTEVGTLLPRRTWPRPRPPRVSDPRTQVGEDLPAHPDTELLRPESCHPASLARYRHLQRPSLAQHWHQQMSPPSRSSGYEPCRQPPETTETCAITRRVGERPQDPRSA